MFKKAHHTHILKGTMKTSVVINSAHPGGYIYHLSVIQQLHNNPGIEKKKKERNTQRNHKVWEQK